MFPPSLKHERKRGSIALITAWAALFCLLAGMAAYVYLSPGGQPPDQAQSDQAQSDQAQPDQAQPDQAQIVVGLPTGNTVDGSGDGDAAMPLPEPVAPESPTVSKPRDTATATAKTVAPALDDAEPAPQNAGETPTPATQETTTAAQETVAKTPEPEKIAAEKTAAEKTAAMPAPAPLPPSLPVARENTDTAATPTAGMATDSEAPATVSGTAPEPGTALEKEQQARLPSTLLAPSGNQPLWQYFGQPFDETTRKPRIAIVVTGLGLSSAATLAAIKQLPPAITLSFSPYTRQLDKWIALARAGKHEVMIDLPMEPLSYPNDDPGPQGLLTGLGAGQNLERLRWALTRSAGYVGVAAVMGSRFIASKEHMEPVLSELEKRGLMFLDNGASDHSVAIELANAIGLPHALNNRSIDEKLASRLAIDARLIQIERMALENGYAVAMARPFPVSIERLTKWASEVEARGFVLAPITALVNREPKS